MAISGTVPEIRVTGEFKMKKDVIKKVLGMLCCFVMLLSINVPVFAEGSEHTENEYIEQTEPQAEVSSEQDEPAPEGIPQNGPENTPQTEPENTPQTEPEEAAQPVEPQTETNIEQPTEPKQTEPAGIEQQEPPMVGESGQQRGGITWTLENGVLTISGEGAMVDYASASGCPWYSRRSEITSVVIGDQVTSIGRHAFEDCINITSLTIPSSVTRIGQSALKGCSSLGSLTIPFIGETKDGTENTHFGYIFGTLNYTNNSSYVPKSLKTVVITGGTRIDVLAFYNCGIERVTLPQSMKSIERYQTA